MIFTILMVLPVKADSAGNLFLMVQKWSSSVFEG